MAELIVPDCKYIEENLSDSEKKLGSIILEQGSADDEGVLRDAVWEVFTELSPLREGLLNWYSFNPSSEILQLCDGYGAITGLLCRAARRVTALEKSEQKASCIAKRHEDCKNLTVMVGNLQFLPEEQKYDYIVVEKSVNTRRGMEKLLADVCPFLKETGRLLFVCENRFGMKYWCGVPDPVKNIPFAGIREAGTGNLLTRNDLLEVLDRDEKVKSYHLYYPFPDAKLPQAIYTDKYQPKASVRDRVIPYYTEEQKKSLVCLENEIYDDLIANGIFNVFANSFLVECSKSEFESETVFAALSTDRGKKHGFATVITARDTVQKRTLWSEGKSSLDLIYQNGQELIQHGLQCVQQELNDTFIEMPFVRKSSLIEHLKEIFFQQKEQVEVVFDQLYQCILQSSEHLGFTECALMDGLLNEENAGVILKKAYIDMIPYNCFYSDGTLLFYDQEFVKEAYPAKYVLFRALRYTYIYIPEAEKIIPLQYFKSKYDLNMVWQAFEREEARFVEDNRNYDLMSSFYRWAGVSRTEVTENAGKLMQESVPKRNIQPPLRRKRHDLSRYERNAKLNRIKQVQLHMLQELMRVCKENDLTCCMFYGSLLGAVRHKGYVPWDDDLDVAMPRKDYDKLAAIAPLVFKNPYVFQIPENDEGCFYGGYGKLRDSSTTGIEERNQGHHCNQGIWIDVFPLDDVLENEEEKQKQFKKIVFYQQLLLKSAYPERQVLWTMKKRKEDRYRFIAKILGKKYLCKKLHAVMTEYGTEISSKVAIMARYKGEQMYTEYDRENFNFVIPMKFEDMMVPVPVGYESCLKEDYGSDYSIYPQECERKPHHVAIFDTEKSYIDYMKESM